MGARRAMGARLAIDAPAQDMPPPPGDSRRRRQRRRGVPPLVTVSTHFNATGWPTRRSVEASMKHDPITNMCVLDHCRCDQLARYSWPCRRARRSLLVEARRRHSAWRESGNSVAAAMKHQLQLHCQLVELNFLVIR